MSQLETAIQHSGERVETNEAVSNETEMTALLHREAAAFSQTAYQLISASLDPVVQEINGEIPVDEIELAPITLPQAADYQSLCVDQDEQIIDLRGQLAALQKNQEELAQALAARVGSPEYLQLQQELQELQAALMEAQQERSDLPPYVPQMVIEEDGRMQPSQIARSIGAAADWAMLLIPGAQVEKAFVEIGKLPKVAKALGKFTGILEKAGKAVKQGDTIKDVLFALKNLSKHTRTSKRREAIAGKAVAIAAKGAGAGLDALHSAQKNADSGSILDLLTVEHWAGKLGAQFDRPPHLVVDKEYEAQYKAEKEKVEAQYRMAQQMAYQKKLEMGLFQKEEEQLRAKEESKRIDQEAVSRQLVQREAQLRRNAQKEALRKWRHDCAIWYQHEMSDSIHDIVDSYIKNLPARLEEYQHQRLQAVRDALEKERTAYSALKDAPEDEIALELRRINESLESVNHVFHK